MKKILYNDSEKVYKPSEIAKVLDISVNDCNLNGNSKGVYFYNVPASFDIETTSLYRDEDGKQYTYEQTLKLTSIDSKRCFEKVGFMYIWQFGINGNIIIGRTWIEFIAMCNEITTILNLNENRRLIVFVHNLSYEFQFIRKLFNWNKVFSIDIRKPIYAITSGFIEFRCSYLLSGYSLSKLGSQLLKYKLSTSVNTLDKSITEDDKSLKMVGDLDYNLIRHRETELTSKELKYCINDVRIVMLYVLEQIEAVKGIRNLPLTKTGFVRKYCRKNCLFMDTKKGRRQNWKYLHLMNELQISDIDEFNALQRSFAGGFTHANAYYTDVICDDVSSFDFTSSYPSVMLAEQFPMSKGVKVDIHTREQFEILINKYCCVFDIEFNNITISETYETPISVSKCIVRDNIVENNGRVVSAERIVLTITNIDYEIIKKFYKWERFKVGYMYCYKKGYLPTEFINSILHLYEKKTTLKGVTGKEQEYLNSKEMLNSCYGMTVTNPLREEFTYTGEWDTSRISENEQSELLLQYNNSRNRFLFYPWGVFITAYARKNLFTAIYECKNDYIYSDTDSIKLINVDDHKQYFEDYNNDIIIKLKEACKYHNIDFNRCEPKTIKGEKKMLGVWDYEGCYKRFKTLGAKRYMIETEHALHDGKQSYDYSLTVSGVNKRNAIPYLYKKFGNEIFNYFTNYLYLPAKATGKNIHTYVDYRTSGEVTDHNGVISTFESESGIHLEPTDYHLSLSIIYLNYLRGLKFKD